MLLAHLTKFMKDGVLLSTFFDLVKIPSPSGYERGMAVYVEKKLFKCGWEVWNDGAGTKNDSDTGDVYAYLEKDKTLPTVVFSAHLDTVQKVGDQVKPIVKDGIIKSDGTTILGADNKAGVACLLTVASEINKEDLKNNLLFFFPTREEAGVMGSSRFEFDKSKIKYVFNLDSSDVPGVFIYRSLGYINFEIIVQGKSAHAAKAYESGLDAIGVACDLRGQLSVGRNLDEGWTMNVGKIVGGGATNVVCDEVVMSGEIRAFDKKIMDEVIKDIRQKCSQISRKSKAGIKVKIDEESYVPPFEGKPNGKLVEICQKASVACGLSFYIATSFSTSDANMYSGKGYQTISVSRGGKKAHSVDEEISIIDLENAYRLVSHLIEMS